MLKASRLLWIVLVFGAFMAFGNDRAEADTVLASWYGPGIDGQLTASGEVFDAHGYTAAHNTLPLGTEVTVTYAGRSVDVVVSDRGPYSGDRELDLSQGAAEYLGLTAAGVDYVDLEVGGSAAYAEPAYEESSYEKPTYEEAEYAEAEYDDGSGGGAASGGSYVVQSGDTLTGIAAELGTSVDSLMAANGLTDPDLLYAGQTLSY
ncbi:MAG: Phage endolysin [uncultured Rubrobacteraceae bacterium]|uniref:Probable endolytic peptidoglycan transglycosylase RlpA n=1 Tax=uncultured Rubrobacteraceae bacterium TaxID=349277 RepID=A0A6J4TMD6_9ACTN|nr:MAG: Phage endolysin [uncultured Rubrobacteraceae bacterium]